MAARKPVREGGVFLDTRDPERGSFGSSAPWPALLGFLGLCLLVGIADTAAALPGLRGWYHALHRPPLSPIPAVFIAGWTLLNLVSGVAAWLLWRRPGHARALRLFGWQLMAGALWPPLCFALSAPGVATLLALVTTALLLATEQAALRLSRPAFWLLLPSLLWTCYAGYLTSGFWLLNRA